MFHHLLIFACACLLFAAPARAADSGAGGGFMAGVAPPALSELIDEAMAYNADIQAMEENARALHAAAPAAGALSDAWLTLGLLNLPTDTFEFEQEPMTQKAVSIAQRFPWFGTLSLREQAAVLDAVRQEHAVRAKRLELARKIAQTWFEAGFVARSLEVNDRLQLLVTQTLRVAETRYATGRGLQQDILDGQVRLTDLEQERIDLRSREDSLHFTLNAMLQRDSYAPINAPARIEHPSMFVNTAQLQSLAVNANPHVAVIRTDIEQAGLNVGLAEKAYYPDMNVMVAYGQRGNDQFGRDRPDFVSTQVGFSLPIWFQDRQDPKLKAAKTSKAAASRALEGLQRTLPHEVARLAAEMRELERSHKLIKDALLIQAGQWAESSLAAYEVGKVDFNTMISARLRVLKLELRAERLIFDIYKKAAELEEVVGGGAFGPATDSAADESPEITYTVGERQ